MTCRKVSAAGNTSHPIEVELQIVKVTKFTALHQRFVAIKRDAKFRLDHVVLALVADAHHESRLTI